MCIEFSRRINEMYQKLGWVCPFWRIEDDTVHDMKRATFNKKRKNPMIGKVFEVGPFHGIPEKVPVVCSRYNILLLHFELHTSEHNFISCW